MAAEKICQWALRVVTEPAVEWMLRKAEKRVVIYIDHTLLIRY